MVRTATAPFNTAFLQAAVNCTDMGVVFEVLRTAHRDEPLDLEARYAHLRGVGVIPVMGD